MADPLVSVVIASDRVEESLPECLASLASQTDPPSFEVLVASAVAPRMTTNPSLLLRWIDVAERNPAHRRNRGAREARGRCLAFLDDDATAEPGWLAAGEAGLERYGVVGGPDLGP